MEVDLENGLDEESEKALVSFRKEINMLSTAVDRIHENVTLIEAQYNMSMDESLDVTEKEHAADQISRLLERTERTSAAIRKRLRRIGKENKDFSSENPEKVGVLRIRVNTHQGLTNRFMEAMHSYEEAQEKHRDHVRGALERQLRKMNPTATDEEIAAALRRGETDSVVDNSPLLVELPLEEQQRLRNGLLDLQSRNNDIRKLEENIIQLHQLFVDMQILVDAQGDLLNNIEYNVVETKEKTEAGFQELIQARAHQKSATKKKICVVLLIVVLLVVILTPILVKYIPVWFPKTQELVSNLPVIGDGAGNPENVTAAQSPSARAGSGTAQVRFPTTFSSGADGPCHQSPEDRGLVYCGLL
eukprot:TRINITY_DN590_c1_g1_i1.p1 TRINITY_DN590_c1_g1~~TRINITY_DN590_c1_g1_i1.p1  ORF type:complete len:360 (+),score=64.20 TRINITY_DN590_c1_g1_i1:114-1193(+)